MQSQAMFAAAPQTLPRYKIRKPQGKGLDGFDPRDPLQTVREYRLRKIATRRIPSRIS